jgi:hypothetical protein
MSGDRPRPDNTGESRGEGNHGPDYISPIGRQEIAQRESTNPAERQKEQERIIRDETRYQAGFPVAGHGEPQPENDPGRERTR